MYNRRGGRVGRHRLTDSIARQLGRLRERGCTFREKALPGEAAKRYADCFDCREAPAELRYGLWEL